MKKIELIFMLTNLGIDSLKNEELIEFVIRILHLLLGVSPLILPFFKIFSPTNKVIGIEDYATRVRTRLKYSLGIILMMGLITLLLGTYREWIPEKLKKDNDSITEIGITYALFSIFFFILSTKLLIENIIKKIGRGLDKYERNYKWEKVRTGYYIFLGLMLMGVSIIINEILTTISCVILILILGFLMILLFDYEADRALLYYEEEEEKIYIYRSIDTDNLLCGKKKNARSCNSYLIKDKNSVLKVKLYVVDKEAEKAKKIKKSIDWSRKIGKIVEVFKEYNHFYNRITVVTAIIVGTLFYNKEKVEIKDFVIMLCIILISNIFIMFIMELMKKIMSSVRIIFLWIKKETKKHWKKIIGIIYALLSILRLILFNRIFLVEWVMHAVILGLGLNLLLNKFIENLKNKSERKIDKD